MTQVDQATTQTATSQIWNSGLPPLGMSAGSGSVSSSNHSSVEKTVRQFGQLGGNVMVWNSSRSSTLYSYLRPERLELDYGSEADVATFVFAALLDICLGHAELRRRSVFMKKELTVVSLRPDVMIFSVNNLPVGFCEVKRPNPNGRNPLDNTRVLGQSYDYAMELRHRHGLRWAFVLLTTYTHWRVLWLDDDACNYAADLVSLDDDAVNGSPVPQAVLSPAVLAERRVNVSEIVEGCSNPALAPFLASVLLKMAASPIQGATQYRPSLRVAGMTWLNFDMEAVDGFALPEDPSPPFVRLEKLGSGRDGSCWMVAKDGLMFVMKIIRRVSADNELDGRQMRAESEAGRWRRLYDNNVRAVIVMGRAAVVMPYVFVFQTPQEYQNHINQVRAAVQHMATNCLVHRDLVREDETIKWWHFGVFPGDPERVFIIDLTDVDEVGTVDEANHAMSTLPLEQTSAR